MEGGWGWYFTKVIKNNPRATSEEGDPPPLHGTQPESPRVPANKSGGVQKSLGGVRNFFFGGGKGGDGHPPYPASPSSPALIWPLRIIPGDSPGTKNGLR